MAARKEANFFALALDKYSATLDLLLQGSTQVSSVQTVQLHYSWKIEYTASSMLCIIMPRGGATAHGSSFVCLFVIMPRRSQEAYCNRAVCLSVSQVFLVAH